MLNAEIGFLDKEGPTKGMIKKQLEDDYSFVTLAWEAEIWADCISVSLMNSSAAVMRLILHISYYPDY